MVRAAAKNHASVAIVTSPARYDAVLEAVRGGGDVPDGLRAALAIEAFRHTAAYDARIAAELPGRMAAAGVDAARTSRACPAPTTRSRRASRSASRRSRRCATARTPTSPRPATAAPAATRRRRPVRDRRAPPLQGKPLSLQQRPRRLGRRGDRPRPRRPGLRDRQAHEPVRRRGTRDARRGLGGGARRRPGLGVRRRRGAHRRGRRRDRRTALASLFLEVVVAPAFEPAAREILAAKPNLRLVDDPLDRDARRPPRTRSARSGRPAAPSSSPPPTPPPTTRRRGRSRRPATPTRRRAARPRPGVAARPRRSRRTRSSSSGTARSSASDRARRAASTPPARRSRRPARSPARRGSAERPAPRTRSTRSRTASRSASRPA